MREAVGELLDRLAREGGAKAATRFPPAGAPVAK